MRSGLVGWKTACARRLEKSGASRIRARRQVAVDQISYPSLALNSQRESGLKQTALAFRLSECSNLPSATLHTFRVPCPAETSRFPSKLMSAQSPREASNSLRCG